MKERSPQSIGIFSYQEDAAVNGAVRSVMDKLDEAGADYHFIASEDVIQGLAKISLTSPFKSPAQASNAWVRKITPGLILHPEKPENDPLNLRGVRESTTFLKEYIKQRYTGTVICDPNKTALAENKITQMRVATEVGLEIPKSIITNSIDDVVRLFGNTAVVYKGISQHITITNFYGKQADNPTTLIRAQDLPDGLIVSPSLFQESIDKKAEYRVTIVGQKTFVAKMTPLVDSIEVDWRDAVVKGEMSFEKGDLPISYKQKLIKLVCSMGLNFASLDVVEDFDGNLYFLDLNPSGNYYYVEYTTGLEISQAIADMLAGRDTIV